MQVKRVQILNYGPIDRLNIEFPFDSEKPKPVVLVGANGSGKSIVLAHLVNGLLIAKEFASPATSEMEIGHVFKARGTPYIRLGAECYFSKVDYGNGLFLTEIGSKRLKRDYQTLPPEFSVEDAIVAWDKMKAETNDDILSNFTGRNESLLNSTFSQNCILYFPPNRFEEPAWLNETHLKTPANYTMANRSDYQSGRRIINYSPLRETQNWLLDLILDRVVLEPYKVNLAPFVDGEVQSTPLQLIGTPAGPASGIYDIATEIVKRIVKGPPDTQLVLGSRFNRLISVGTGEGLIIPNIFQLSSGETSLVDMFLSILRDFDLCNISFNSAQEVKGIVLVDEIDLHLHADHQFEVLPGLIKMFPNVQFVIASHSPLFVLGMQQAFGEDGFALYRMPQGQQISPEEFTEFGDAYRAFSGTSKFSDDVRMAIRGAQGPILYLEGTTDVRYLKQAAELLGRVGMLAGVEVDEREGGGNLRNIWNAIKNLPEALVPRKVMLLHDSDFSGQFQTVGSRYRLKIPFQNDNPIEKGIENLFGRETLLKVIEHKPDFIDVIEAHPERVRGVVQTVPEKWVVNGDEKTNLCSWLCENGTVEDFRHFQVIFDLLEGALGYTDEEPCSSA